MKKSAGKYMAKAAISPIGRTERQDAFGTGRTREQTRKPTSSVRRPVVQST